MKLLYTLIFFVVFILNLKSQNLPDPRVFTNVFFAQDKLLHLGAGYAIGASTTAIADRFGSKRPELWGIGFTVLAAAGKEIYDYKTGGTPEMLDALMAFNGGFLGTVTVMLPIEKRKRESVVNKDVLY